MISDKSASLSISVKELTKKYGHVYALNNVSIDVKAGEFLTLLGPSGSGKTTLLMAIAGFNRPDSGGIYFGKQDVTILPPHKRGVGMVFQNYALFPHMSVFDNVAFHLSFGKLKLTRNIDVSLKLLKRFNSRILVNEVLNNCLVVNANALRLLEPLYLAPKFC